MRTPRFADGRQIPDDEVIFDPDVEKACRQASRDSLAALKAKLLKHITDHRKRPEKRTTDT